MCNGSVSSYSCITLALHCAVTSRIGMLIAMGGGKGHWLGALGTMVEPLAGSTTPGNHGNLLEFC